MILLEGSTDIPFFLAIFLRSVPIVILFLLIPLALLVEFLFVFVFPSSR